MKKIFDKCLYLSLAQLVLFLLLIHPDVLLAKSLEVEFSFTPPDDYKNQVDGFSLFIDGSQICTNSFSSIELGGDSRYIFKCNPDIEDGTYGFQLKAHFSDGNESPLSEIFEHEIESISETSGGSVDPDSTVSDAMVDYGNVHSGVKQVRYSWSQDSANNIVGYRMYLNDEVLCETISTSESSLTCTTNLRKEPMEFSVAHFDNNGVESERSNILSFNPVESLDLFVLKKRLKFKVNYEGDRDSVERFRVFNNTELICESTSNYVQELYCDAEVFEGDNIFSILAVLTDGTESLASNTIVFNSKASVSSELSDKATEQDVAQPVEVPGAGDEGEVANTVAVISSNPTAVGDAPLQLVFDGSGSTSSSQPLTFYWSFGDGEEKTGEIVEHTYLQEGSFDATLTVVDSDGRASSISTPILVNAPSGSENNLPPLADISAIPVSGDCPLAVSFSGSGSADSDGAVDEYNWSFGDGVEATGESVSHIFTKPGAYQVKLQVVDDKQVASSFVSQEIVCSEATPEITPAIQVGEVSIGPDWVTVMFGGKLKDPVVVAGPLTFNGTGPALVQIRNVTEIGFEIRLREWSYQDGAHPLEQVSYIVLESGVHTLQYGKQVEAGFFEGTSDTTSIQMQNEFNSVPVVLTTISSHNEDSPVVGRTNKITKNSFQYHLQEEEKADGKHFKEIIAYIAWEPGVGVDAGIQYEVSRTGNKVTHNWSRIDFQEQLRALPFFLAEMQTIDGSDPASIRHKRLSPEAVYVKVQEERSKNVEMRHTTEVIGYLVVGAEE